MRRSEQEMNRRDWWRNGRRRMRGDWCCTALCSDVFERNHPELVIEEIHRGSGGRLPRLSSVAS